MSNQQKKWNISFIGGEWVWVLPYLQKREDVEVIEREAGPQNEDPSADVLVIALKTWFAPSILVDISRALYMAKIPVIVFGDFELFQGSTFDDHPLLFLRFDGFLKKDEAFLDDFLTPPKNPGKVFVIDGGDGAGKACQTNLLVSRLRSEGYPVQTLDFPQDKGFAGPLIREVLTGRKGKLNEVDPRFFSFLYSINRYDSLQLLHFWIKQGNNIVLDRYMEANFGHQASKLESSEEREKLIESLKAFEIGVLGLPASSRVFYLDLPPDFAMRALKSDSSRDSLDMHETAGLEYKKAVRNAFTWCCDNYSDTWTRIPCVSDEGDKRFSKECVHETIWNVVKDDLVNGAMKA